MSFAKFGYGRFDLDGVSKWDAQANAWSLQKKVERANKPAASLSFAGSIQLTHAMVLKKLTSKVFLIPSISQSAIRATSPRMPWLTTNPSILPKADTASSTAF
jgi:hypothetical protein